MQFEVRPLDTGELLDPLGYFNSQILDTKKPVVRGLLIYPMAGKGVVNDQSEKQALSFETDADGNVEITTPIQAWGEVSFGIRAHDRMDNTHFSYGLKDVLMSVDGIEMYHSYSDRFSLEESRYLNSYVDYEEWANNRTFYIKTFVAPGNPLRMVASRNQGKLDINEERTYHVSITLADFMGNSCQIPIQIEGKKQPIPPLDTLQCHPMTWHRYNQFSTYGIDLQSPDGHLYDNLYMYYNVIPNTTFYADIHTLHNCPVPLHKHGTLALRLEPQADTLTRKAHYGIVQLKNNKPTWIGGKYHDGWIETTIRELGSYTVAADLKPPTITPIQPEKWVAQKCIRIRITDDLSGVASFRGEIDQKYALFEYDGKKSMLTYTFDPERLTRGTHSLRLIVVDGCGQKSIYTHTFTW